MSPEFAPSPHPRYRLLARLGAGGMGEVFRAHDRLTSKIVALKQVRLPVRATAEASPLAARDKTSLGQAATMGLEQYGATMAASNSLRAAAPVASAEVLVFEPAAHSERQALRLHLAQEFRTLAGLRHPHIVSVLDYGFDSSQQPYFTMELLAGGKTVDEASHEQPQSLQVALLLQILQALTYLHRRGVLHCDLKPGNILVTARPRGPHVKLLDFGLAHFALGLDKRGDVAGTLGYIAPEVLLGMQPTEASDLFAVGVIAHEILVGAHPLGRLPTVEMIRGFLGSAPIYHESAQLPSALSAVLRRALSRAPEERFSDAVTFGHELARAAGLALPSETLDIRESFLQAARFQSRDSEMAALLALLRQAAESRGQVLLIGGESGVGKSRLLDELRAQALVRGARVLRGQAVREGGGAFLVLRDVLTPLCIEQPLDELQSGVLLSLVPRLAELLERPVAAAPDLDAKSTQDRALMVIEQVLCSAPASAAHPLVLLLEDLQWAGAEVLLLLDRLSNLCKNRPLLIFGSYRDDERPDLPAVIPNAQVLKLQRFSRESVAEMATAMLGAPGQRADVVDRLFQETEGNAFFIVEVLRALAEDAGQLAAVGIRELPAQILAGGMRAVLKSRLDHVPDWARGRLEWAAVAGRQLDLKALGNSGGSELHSDTAIDTWLATCADLSILEISDQTWRFSHDKMREYLLEQIDQRGELQRVHREVAVAIERSYVDLERDAYAAALAFHFSKAGDVKQAARYGLRAGERSLNGGALADAVEQLQATLRHQARCATTLVDGVLSRRLLSTALFALGYMEECVSIVREAFALAGHPLPPRTVGRAVALSRAFGTQAARQVFPALRLTPEVSPTILRELELVGIRCGAAFSFTGAAVDSVVATASLFVLSKQIGTNESADFYTGSAGYMFAQLPLGSLHRRGPWELPERRSDFVEAHCFRRLLTCAVNAGRGYWEDVVRGAAVGSEEAAETGNFQFQMYFTLSLLMTALYRGDFSTAHSHASTLAASSAQHKNAMFENWSIMAFGVLDLIEMHPTIAIERLRNLHTRAADIGDALNVLNGLGLLSRACLMAGDRARARHFAEEALHGAAGRPLFGYGVLDGYTAPAEVFIALAKQATADAEQRTLSQRARQALLNAWYYALTYPIGRPRAALATGKYARMQGHHRLARRFFTHALAAARELSMSHEAAQAQAALNELAPSPSSA